MNVKQLYISIDSRMLHQGGIGTYLTNLLKVFEQMSVSFVPIDFSAPIFSWKEQKEFLKIPPCDLFWSPHFNAPLFSIKAKARVLTLHDVYHLDHFEKLSLAKKIYLKTIFPLAIQKSDQIITVSEFSKKRILAHFPQHEKKITVIYPGADHFQTIQSTFIHPLPKQFFLFVGNKKPHKNRKILYETMKQFSSMHLVIIGNKEPIGLDLQNRVHFFSSISNQELKWLYQKASALIFPSFYEGWGLPPLEAMQIGCPVIASHEASIPEACGKACLYFDPYKSKDLLEKMKSLPSLRTHLIELGKKHAEKFTWKETAEKHLEIFLRTVSLLQEGHLENRR